MKLNERIKFFRKQNKLTQEKLSELLSCSIDTLQRWENGTREPRVSDISRLCEVFHCTEMELLNGSQSEEWELKIKLSKEGVIDVSGLRPSAEINVGDKGIAVTLSGSYELWADDAKFENFIEQLRNKRQAALKFYQEAF